MANDVATDATDDAVTGEPPRRRQRFDSIRNMVLSLAVICAGAFGLVLFNPGDQPEGSTPTVSYEVEATTAARAAPYELLVPEGLPEGWRATSVRYEPLGEFGATWHLGFLDPDDEYVAVRQADGDAGEFVADATRDAEDTGSATAAGGRDWARYEGSKYDALVLAEPDATTVVMGTASFDRLEQFAGALVAAAE
ncbi:DUF4245 domain-containing protein [Streptomyces litchfieldiae]|uniref:DUF4245 domain-containing protein n=1 Tax=Streptomyces litchfieldiae TaxID=3075543 RepID=A0ABU2MP20_9ACTN|nr:DUF4245 domain-containing protein [Streptomyces sp. DSM 44938]MDT0342399.1 DUF4245 domain-containing protein [Streptomyces sp. DSM 44938]